LFASKLSQTNSLRYREIPKNSKSKNLERESDNISFDPNENKGMKRKRGELIEEYFTLEDELRSQSFHQAYLSIDLVGATKMKEGQDALQVELSFRKYHSFLELILKSHAVVQSTWAGDGSMSSFDESQHAVDAVIEFLEKLSDFNPEQNRLAKPFTPRCGIHSGTVYADRSTRIEEIFSNVIDIAGHLQKRAEPNGLLISEATFNEIENKSDFRTMSFEVDGQRVWSYISSSDQLQEDKSRVPEDQRSVARRILISLYEAWAAHTIISLNPICEQVGCGKGAFHTVVKRLEEKHGLIKSYGSSYTYEITPMGVLYVEDNNLLSSSGIDVHQQIRRHILEFLAALYEREGILADAHYETIAEGGPVSALDMLVDLSLLRDLNYVKDTSINTFQITEEGFSYYRGADYEDII
jgi:class 3 adenylate cyclase